MSVPESPVYSPCDFAHAGDEIAARAVARQFKAFPELERRYGQHGRGRCEADARYHILYLAEAVSSRNPALFNNYVIWLKGLLSGLNIPIEDLSAQFGILAEILQEHQDSSDAALAADYLYAVVDRLPSLPDQPASHILAHNRWDGLARELLDHLLACRRVQAIQLVETVAGDGADIMDIYLQLFQPLLREIGRLWQMNQLSVAQEHYCTAVIQLLMGRLSARVFTTERIGRTLVAACVGDELHEIGLRMVADCFELAGWDSHFLGANVPTRDLLRLLEATNADVLCLSVTLTTHLAVTRHIVNQIRAESALPRIKIVVGGYPFNAQADLWRHFSVDGHAQDARSALELCNHLVESGS